MQVLTNQNTAICLKSFNNLSGLSIIVFSDWYNTTVMKKVKFYDEVRPIDLSVMS